MAFNQYLFDRDAIQEAVKQSTDNLKANKGFSDLEGYAIGVIKHRLDKDPSRYKDYGMYWAALKEVLRKHGYDYGSPILPMIRTIYCGESDIATVVMADEFRKFYLSNWAIGTSQFILDPEDPIYIDCVDDEMELLIS